LPPGRWSCSTFAMRHGGIIAVANLCKITDEIAHIRSGLAVS
jgi:hypothetical protein